MTHETVSTVRMAVGIWILVPSAAMFAIGAIGTLVGWGVMVTGR